MAPIIWQHLPHTLIRFQKMEHAPCWISLSRYSGIEENSENNMYRTFRRYTFSLWRYCWVCECKTGFEWIPAPKPLDTIVTSAIDSLGI